MARTFDFASQQPLVLRCQTGLAAGPNFSALGHKPAQRINVFVVDFYLVRQEKIFLAAASSAPVLTATAWTAKTPAAGTLTAGTLTAGTGALA